MLAMVNAHPYLLARTSAMHFHKQMHDLQNGSMYQALSREAKTKMGLSPSFCVYDEYGSAPDDLLYRAMDSAMGARSAPLMMIISTQAADDNAPLSRLIDYGKQVKVGTIKDPSFHLTLYAARDKDNPWLPKTWLKANPALDDFRSLEDVRRQALQAKRMPSQENSFRNLILNQRVSAHVRFISKSTWDKCKKKPKIPDGVKVYAALDLGSTRDMSALILLHQDIEGHFHVMPFFWLPGSIDARANEDSMPYAMWVKEGLLTPAGDATDPALIARKIAELNGKYRIQTLAFDRWRIAEIKRELEDIGCRVPLVEHGQGFRDMSPCIDVLERMVESGRLRHGGHPILTMNAANAVITRDAANNRKLDKSKSTGRIDGLVALCMAFSPAVVKLEKPFDIRTLIA
jgi:phage terminase large subunit-like protein